MYEYKATVSRVVDGDTLDLFVDLGFYTCTMIRIHLIGVDAPETFGVSQDSEEYRQGKTITAFVEEWVRRAPDEVIVATEKDKSGRYGRWFADIWFNENGERDSLSEAVKEAIERKIWETVKA